MTAGYIPGATVCFIKSNQITFIVTSPQHKCLGEWNSYERAPDSAKKTKNTTQQFTYGQYIFTDCTEDNVQNTHTYTQYTQCTIKTYFVTNAPIHIIHRIYTSALCPHICIVIVILIIKQQKTNSKSLSALDFCRFNKKQWKFNSYSEDYAVLFYMRLFNFSSRLLTE